MLEDGFDSVGDVGIHQRSSQGRTEHVQKVLQVLEVLPNDVRAVLRTAGEKGSVNERNFFILISKLRIPYFSINLQSISFTTKPSTSSVDR